MPFIPQMTQDAQSSGISSLQRHVSITAFASNSGQGQSVEGLTFTQEEIASLRKRSILSFEETTLVLKRYGTMDPSPSGKNGISVQDCIDMPEFTGNMFAPDVIGTLQNQDTKKIHGLEFLKICGMFSSRTPALTKKEFLFDMFDVDKQKVLTHDGMFRIYKLMFTNAISDDHILALVFSALKHPDLARPGEITKNEFIQMIPDEEIHERFQLEFVETEFVGGK